MAATTEPQNPSSINGSDQIETMYDKFQKTLLPPSEEKKKSKGKFYKFVGNIFKAAGDDASSSDKDQKRDGATAAAAAAAAPPPPPPTGSNGDVTQNNTGEGSSSQKRKILKTYDPPPKARGFEKDEMSLEIMLLEGGRDDSFKTIRVVGLPGVGKTTLCKSILKNERVKSSYGRMVWISLSEKPNTEEETVERTLLETGVTEDIIEHISEELKLSELPDDLNQQLKENKYLIVFDDVGEQKEDSYYEKLKNCLSNGLPKEKGGAVIVTCRSEEAANKMVGDNSLHRLQPLKDPKSCWLIYNDAVKGSETDENITVSKDVMEELMKRCGGLPGAAQMMGKIKAKQIQKIQEKRLREKNKANQNNSTSTSTVERLDISGFNIMD